MTSPNSSLISTSNPSARSRFFLSDARLRDAMINGTAGAAGGAAAAILTAPLDMAKVRLQNQNNAGRQIYRGTIGTLSTIFKQEGIRGWYTGLGTSLFALCPNWAIQFTFYSEFKGLWASRLGLKDGPTLHLMSAIPAGWGTDLCCQPLWLAKTRLMTQQQQSILSSSSTSSSSSSHAARAPPQLEYRNTFHTLSTVVRQEGVLSLYRGLSAQLLWNSFTLSIQFPMYERLKLAFAEHYDLPKEKLQPWHLLISSASAKVIATTTTYPLETVRTRRQSQRHVHTSMSHTITSMLRTEGWRCFYQGLFTNMCRVVPSASVTFTIYELVYRRLRSWEAAQKALL